MVHPPTPRNNATNIKKVIVNNTGASYDLEISVEAISPETIDFTDSSLFVLATADYSVAQQITKDNSVAVKYLTKQKTNPAVVYTVSSLRRSRVVKPPRYFKKTQSGYNKNLVMPISNVSNLVVFAGILKRTQLRKGEATTLISIDTLTILRNGAPQENNILLFEDTSHKNLWLGQAFQDNSGIWYKQSGLPTASPQRLYSVTVPNTKVIYKSQLDENLLKTLANSFNDLYILNKAINSKQAIVNQLKSKSRNYFSPLYFAKTTNLSLPLSFSFNRLDFFRNNGLFSKLIKNETEMIKSFDLVETKILRKRVLRNSPASRLTAASPLEDYDGREYLVEGAMAYPNLIETNGILSISSTDTQLESLTAGLYVYGVEMTFVDKTQEKLQSLLLDPTNGLSVVTKGLQDLHQEMNTSGNYNVYEQRFGDAYYKTYTSEEKVNIITAAIRSYISAISLFHKDLATAIKSTPDSLATKLFVLADPMTRGPVGISELIKLLSDLQSEIERQVKINNPLAPSAAAAASLNLSRFGTGNKVLKIKHFFEEVVDADDLVDNGLDFLTLDKISPFSGRYNPFRQIPYSDFLTLLTNESTKYNSLATSKYLPVSLTPNYFRLLGNSHKINSKDPNQPESDSVVATSLLVTNKYRNSPLDFAQFNIDDDTTNAATAPLSILKNNLKVMEKESCTVDVDLHEEDSGIFGTYGPPIFPSSADNYLDAADKMSEESPFVINKTGSVSLRSFLLHTMNNVSQEAYYAKLQRLNNDLLSYLVQTDYYTTPQGQGPTAVKNITDQKVFASNNINLETFNLRMLELQRSSPGSAATSLNTLLLGQQEPESVTAQEMNYATYISNPVSASSIPEAALKYGNIKKIQYLAGFSKLNDSLLMKNPLWITMTRQGFESFSQSGKVILCRMVSSYSEFSKYRGVSSPLYDEVFMLGPSPNAPANTTAMGNSSFTVLGSANFASFNNMVSMDASTLNYSFSTIDGARANSMMSAGSVGASKNSMMSVISQGGY